jgi:hypothetical protein
MNLRIAARRPEPYEGRYVLDIVGAGSYVTPKDPAEQPAALGMAPPSFPQQALDVGAQVMVYLLLRIGRDGKVEDGIAEQVNLRFVTARAA